ncbi:hypothetical protein COOONC_15061 [Cooperia oncophora]
MMDEVRLRDIIANSIVVPVYEEDVIYETAPPQDTREENQQREIAMQTLDTHPREPKTVAVVPENDEQHIEVIDVGENDENMQMTVVNDASPSVAMPLLEQDISIENEPAGSSDAKQKKKKKKRKLDVETNGKEEDVIVLDNDMDILEVTESSSSSKTDSSSSDDKKLIEAQRQEIQRLKKINAELYNFMASELTKK